MLFHQVYPNKTQKALSFMVNGYQDSKNIKSEKNKKKFPALPCHRPPTQEEEKLSVRTVDFHAVSSQFSL